MVPGLGYRFTVPEYGVQFDLTRLRREHHETVGLLTVRVSFRGAKTVVNNILSSADFNCSGARARTDRAKFLEQRAQTKPGDIDWIGLVEELCIRALEAEDTGQPECPLEHVPMTEQDDVEIHPGGLPLLRRHPVIWFADGGAGKSYLALYIAVDLAQAGERVLYCDWEFSGEDHRRRLHRLVGPIPSLPNLLYRHCDRPLAKDVLRLKEIISSRKVTYLVCDSLGFATDGAPEAAEAATGYFRALRELGMLGSLHLAHINKAEQGDQKPFGSVFWHNGARATWFLKRTDAGTDAETGFTVGAYNRKTNIGRLRAPIGIRLEFIGTETRITPGSLNEYEELAAKLPLWQRMKGVLSKGAIPTKDLSTALGVPEAQIRMAVTRRDGLFLRLADGRVALKDQP